MIHRVEQLKPDAQRVWGKMNVAQMLAHCVVGIESARGNHHVPRVFIGYLFGRMAKRGALGPKPFRKNSPTDKTFIVPVDVNFEEYQKKLIDSLKKFQEGGAANCTKHPHPFFGHLSPDEWSVLQWKHLDHHLRQFGA